MKIFLRAKHLIVFNVRSTIDEQSRLTLAIVKCSGVNQSEMLKVATGWKELANGYVNLLTMLTVFSRGNDFS